MSVRALLAIALIAAAMPAFAQETPPATEPAPAAAPALPEATERCGVIVNENGRPRTHAVEGYSIANATPPMRLPDGFTEVQSVICGRSEMLFTLNDFRVITDLRVPFSIVVGDRLVSIEMVNGQFSASARRGVLSADEMTVLQRALNDAQHLAQAQPAQ